MAQILINVSVDDLEAELARLAELGPDLIHASPQSCPVGIYAAVRDPSGNVLELLEFRRFR